MSAGKTIGGLILGLVAVVAIGGYFFLSNLDGIIKDLVEEIGSEVTGTKVSLNSVELDLTTGKGKLKGLTIANPAGYDSDYAFKLQNISVGISPASLSGPVVVISEVKIVGAKLIAEQKGEKSNLPDILDNIKKSSKKGDTESETPTGEEPSSDIRLMMEKFVFIKTEATLVTEKNGEKSIKIPDVRRKNIGDKNTGLSPEQLAEEVLGTVVKAVEKAVGQYLAELAGAAVEKKLTEKLGAEDKSKLDGIKSMFKKDE
jgi:uncharacterized protein involved in outer membrane biogenesis